jgi:hypothetical protein
VSEAKAKRRTVENEDVGLVPHGGSQHDLDLLAARQSRHAVVRGKLGLEAAVRQVLLDVG